MKNKLVEKYNDKNTVLVISSYPDKKTGIKKLNAVAWHAKKTFQNLAKEKKIVIFAEIIEKPEIFLDGNILVARVWRRGNISLFKDVFAAIRKFSKAKLVLLEFEFNMFGGIAGTLLLPFFLFILKIFGKKIVLEIHQVVLDVNSLSGHLNLKKGRSSNVIFNLGLGIFYRLICFTGNRVIVLEEELKRRLSLIASKNKIVVLPIATATNGQLTKQRARRELKIGTNEFILLYFGFVTWYKGADWLVNQVKRHEKKFRDKKIRLIIAGGPSLTLQEKAYYQNFYQKILKAVKKSSQIEITGFIDEDRISAYFIACDLVIFPYRTFMSSSGPLSWALSFKKPFIMSTRLKRYFESGDFKQALDLSGLNINEICFSLTAASFTEKIEKLTQKGAESKKVLQTYAEFSAILSEMRSSNKLTQIYLKELEYVSNSVRSYRSILGKLQLWRLAFRLG
ncbi:glycosyltransferase [Candidatus Microgenomates bacterium]|nr:glycosyltransferase [Candidatus Microgenomates bacterium]